ncbi:MAG TPA: hypothetical protein IGS53_13295 [Leptolyngbyaceae cyanobacterium M33_DOE_097]|nr:hypothetical protein [Leptolyngbyaceae cyanobacterium M33_DOE_097]
MVGRCFPDKGDRSYNFRLTSPVPSVSDREWKTCDLHRLASCPSNTHPHDLAGGVGE